MTFDRKALSVIILPQICYSAQDKCRQWVIYVFFRIASVRCFVCYIYLYSTAERIYFVGCVNFSFFPFSFIMLMLAILNGTLLAVGFYLLFFLLL